jgi:MYXO-CTERM domain-containing protein
MWVWTKDKMGLKIGLGGSMKKLAAVCATIVLATSLGLAQGTASQTASDDNRASAPPTTTRNDDSNRRGNDFGWIGLLGLLGLAGLRRRPSVVADREREMGGNLRRVA